MIENFLEIFMDDFLIYGRTFDKYLEHLRLVLERCKEKNLVLNWEKCHFIVNQGLVLGHIVSRKGIELDKAKVDLIQNLPPPTSIKEICCFLGHTSFYYRFIKDFSKITHPLTKLFTKDVFNFDNACLKSFNALKCALVSPPMILAPNWHTPFEIM
jgi:hypothetical protein